MKGELTMVTTISCLNGNLRFRASDLLSESDSKEDHDLVEMVRQVLIEVVEKLVPVLTYVDKVITGVDQVIIDVRGIEVVHEGGFSLILDRAGNWYRFDGLRADKEDNAWQRFFVSDVLEGLEKAFTEATEKKKKHLAAIEARRSMLQKILDVVHS
ncbi:MAG: hypothetical protein Q7S43_02795 [bacterium]|nr:hypothetical protein [bacterium]MDO8496357.1 hypothetical protein [bacterium]